MHTGVEGCGPSWRALALKVQEEAGLMLNLGEEEEEEGWDLHVQWGEGHVWEVRKVLEMRGFEGGLLDALLR